MTYQHRLHRVVVYAEYVDLVEPRPRTRRNDSVLGFATRMRTNEDAYRVSFITADSSKPEGRSSLVARHGRVRCAVGHRIDYEANTLTMSIPRSCLSRPRWVRFTSAHFTYDGDTETSDQPHDTGAVPTAWTSKVGHRQGPSGR